MNNNLSSETVYVAPDYSKVECWYKLPEITKEVDTFYIYATEYIRTSLEEGAPDYAALDNAEMLQGVVAEYIGHATTFEDSKSRTTSSAGGLMLALRGHFYCSA